MYNAYCTQYFIQHPVHIIIMFEKNNSETYEGGYLKKVVIEKTTIYMHQCNKNMIKDLCISINAQIMWWLFAWQIKTHIRTLSS